jgi:hypothetical protein
MTVSVQGTGGETVVFQTRKITGDDLETNAALLDLDDIPMPSGVQDSNSATYANFSAFFSDLPTNASLKGPDGPQGPAIDTVSLSQSVDLSTVTMAFTYQKDGQTYNISTTPTFTIPAGPTGQKGDQGNPGTNGTNGVDGQDGSDGVSVTDVNQVNSTTINFDLSNGTTTSNVTLPTQTATDILPSYTNNAGKVLAVNSTTDNIEWVAAGTGTVTSVGLTGANGITFSGSPITTSGTISTSVDAATLKTHLAITFADVGSTPTTIAGYGITDAFDGAFSSLTSKPTTIAGYGITDAFSGVFADLSSKPTTVAGYGITDAFSGAYADLSGKPTIPSTVSTLTDVTISTVADNELLAYDTTAGEWINQTPAEAGFATVATSGAFADLTGTPTTIAGYGITDAFDGAFASLTSTPTTIAGYGITDAFDGAFSSLTSTPTTLAGYGITDALTSVDLASDVGSTVLPVANGGTGITAGGSDRDILAWDSANTQWISTKDLSSGTYYFATARAKYFRIEDSLSPPTDEKYSYLRSIGGVIKFQTLTDAGSTGSTIFEVTRTGTTVDSFDFTVTPSVNGVGLLSGTVSVANGGTGLTALGSAGQVLTVNSAGTALEYQTPSGGGGGITEAQAISYAIALG